MDKKNAIVLTVIAVLTLLVTLIGATFAYFSAQTGDGSSAPVTVTTNTTDSLNYGSFGSIILNVTQKNFFENAGDQQGKVEGSVTLKASNIEGHTASFCYTVSVDVSSNDFVYTTDDEDAELVIAISKNGTAYESITDLTYVDLGERTICDNGSLEENACTESHQENVAGFDVTTLEAKEGAIKIPNLDDATNYIHNITAAADQTETDDWAATVTFINLPTSQSKNYYKQFTGTLKFTTVECE